MRLFVTALRPHWSVDRMAAQHEELIRQLESRGPLALRAHLESGLQAMIGPDPSASQSRSRARGAAPP